ncbi:MAG: lyase family protein [Candidatus Liptonbacteria bacterium]|nr:lyase family protein [Candidatus Liptonbacteria bacterium]
MERNLALPGNPRYQPKDLRPIWGYDYLMRAVAQVEIATLRTLAEFGKIPQEHIALLTPEIVKQLEAITTTEVDEIERTITKHDIRAWVRRAQEILPEPLRRYVHIPLTSYDALDTARMVQFAAAHEVVERKTVQVIKIFAGLVETYAGMLQIGRTHGQHALPITVGFWLATILERIMTNLHQLDHNVHYLRGKISGAVGARNAQMVFELTGNFEESVLRKLNLKPARISTQILPPEPLAYYLFSCVALSASLAQFAHDCRHLMRNEIGEVCEEFEAGQVGSSTMAHKRNPVTFENIEGTWLKTKNQFGNVLDTLISGHQRDLVGSAPARDFPVIVINLVTQLDTLLRPNKMGVPFLSRIKIDEKRCEENLMRERGVLAAETLYIALQLHGYEGDAHTLVNEQLVPEARTSNSSIYEILLRKAEKNKTLRAVVEQFNDEVVEALARPWTNAGTALERARKVLESAHARVNAHRTT